MQKLQAFETTVSIVLHARPQNLCLLDELSHPCLFYYRVIVFKSRIWYSITVITQMRTFALSDDKKHVFIEGSKATEPMGRVSVQMGTVMWCLETDNTDPSDVVVLSFAIPEGMENKCDMLINIQQYTDFQTKELRWPTWQPMSPPLPHTILLCQWITLLNPESKTNTCGDVVKGAIHTQIISETKTTQSIEDRCKSISLHGEDDDFIVSLDYYVTMQSGMLSE
jgi:hypothetical protein